MSEEVTSGTAAEGAATPRAKSLGAFLSSKVAAKTFLADLESGEAGLPSEEERSETIGLCLTDLQQGTKLLELVRLAAADETAGRVRKSLLFTGSEFVRAQDHALRSWGLIATAGAEVELGTLARNLRNARDSNDKNRVTRAELAHCMGLAILTSRLDFNIVGALRTVGQQLFAKPLEAHVAEKIVAKALRRDPSRKLETLAAVAQVHFGALEESRKRQAASVGELQSAREELRRSRETRATLQTEVVRLGDELSLLKSELDRLNGKIAGVKGGAADDLTRLKARVRQFYEAKVLKALTTTDEALSLDPPSYRVARERVTDVLMDVRKELEWLDQS